MVALIVVVVLVLAAVGFVIWRRKTADPAVVAAKQELSERTKALKAAKKERADAIGHCQKELAEAQRKYNQYVNSAQKKLAELEDPKGKRLGTYRGIHLYERWIETPHGNGPVAGTVATVDSQVSSRITATRLVTIGLFALAAKKKTGANYLSIDSPALASVIECPPEQSTLARQFAVKITNAGKAAVALEEQLPEMIEQAKADLKACQEFTRPTEVARADLAAIEAEPTMLETIRAAEEGVATAQAKIVALTPSKRKALPAA